MGQQDLTVSELVDKIKRGDIQLPEMQRQYVWEQTRVRDLLDSLYRGYPSGTILTWETDKKVATRDFAVAQEASGQRSFQLLLDGQQRLTSLSAVLRGEQVKVRDRKRSIDILFNLEHPENLEESTEVFEDEEMENDTDLDEDTTDTSEDKFQKRFAHMAFVVHSNRLAKLPYWVSVTKFFKESNDVLFLKNEVGVKDFDDPRCERYADRLRQLRAIRDYNYRVNVLDQNKSYKEVTEIFVRVNSLGTKLRSSDLALAQITAEWPGSLSIFQKFEEECIKRNFDLGLAIHLKNLVAFATGQSRFKAVGSLSKKRLKDDWEEAKKGMDFALEFLSSNVGIDSLALLSSPFITITLAAYGRLKKYQLSPEESARLRYWTLMANAKARYSRGSSETFLDQDLAALRRDQSIEGLLQLLKTQVGRLDVLPSDLENRNIRSAYFKTMFMAFKQDGARDWHDQLVISLKRSGSRHDIQFHHIFPQAVLRKSNLSSQEINDICNLTFISGGTNRRLSDTEPAVYLDNVNPGELDKQCIPVDESLWEVSAYEKFLSKRRELVAEKLNQFLGHKP